MTKEEIKTMTKEERKRQLEWSDPYEFGTVYAEYLLEENQQLKEHLERYEIIIFNLKEQLKKSEKARKEAIDKLKTLGKFDGEKCTRSFKLWTADFNELIRILDIDKGE